jgi:hypothetical protein
MKVVMLNDEALEQVVGGLTVAVGLNSPKGPNYVTAPAAAIQGVMNAFTQVVTKGPGDIANIAFLP